MAPAPRTIMSLMARCGFAEIFGGDNFEFVRQQPLLDKQDGIVRAVEGDGAVRLRATADGDVHKFIKWSNVGR